MFSIIVYILCAATSSLCAILLIRGYRQSRARLLLWSAACFVGLALNNILLLVDTSVLTDTDLSVVRILPAIAGASALLYGLVWETQ
ncbi:MAG TPA: DUF5985 family protein [Thermoanaerobaculia bacterium]|nr:DUF5985 family protein [Thermoanaerobaculia bacterium]